MGYGKRVMEAIEQMAVEDDFSLAILDAQCHAESFYQQLGYLREDIEPFFDAGILHVRMRKVIESTLNV